MRCIGITNMLPVADTAQADAQERERVWGVQAQNLPAQDFKP